MPYDAIYIWNLKYDTIELINEALTDRKQTCDSNRVGVGMEEEWTGSLVLIDANYYV